MCGICGYIFTDPNRFQERFIHKMNETLSHRGNDGNGTFIQCEAGFALGHTRLKILDLSERGKQPMCDNDETIIITYNGEIYNFKEEREELEKRGYRFRSQTDTEVVLYAYKEYGKEKFIHRLNGDFAFAIWDKKERELVIFRDRVGIRPVYYTFQNGVFAFASEVKALLVLPHIKKEPNIEKFGEYMAHLYIYGHETLYKGIYELQPGESLVYKEGEMKIETYFDFTFDPLIRNMPHKEQEERFLELFDDSIVRRLNADVPVGIYLSGGIDSSLLIARLARVPNVKMYTYTLGFEYGQYNEFQYSEFVAKKFKTNHTSFIIKEDDFFDVVSKVIYHYDEPVPNIVSVPQYYLAQQAKKHITVSLAGSGGDELFAGYTHYLAAQQMAQGSLDLNSISSEKAAYQRTLSHPMIACEFKSCSQKYLVDNIILPINSPDNDYRQNISKYFERSNFPDFISRMLYMDFKTHVIAMMNKDDKMNMAFGVEGRFPYFDYRLVQHALSMSPELKINNGVTKYLLKELCLDYFPREFVYREKQAFPTPVELWFKSNPRLLEFPLLKKTLGNVFNFPFIETLKEELTCGKSEHTRRLWGLFCLEKWLAQF